MRMASDHNHWGFSPALALVALTLCLAATGRAQDAAPVVADVRTELSRQTNSIGMVLARIPAGEFVMGRSAPADDLAADFVAYERERIDQLGDEQPAHRVRITRSFDLAIHEVTISQFRRFVDQANYQTEAERDGTGGWGYNPTIAYFEGRKPEYSWRNPGFVQAGDHPVVNVSWNDA